MYTSDIITQIEVNGSAVSVVKLTAFKSLNKIFRYWGQSTSSEELLVRRVIPLLDMHIGVLCPFLVLLMPKIPNSFGVAAHVSTEDIFTI